ncbi:S41 family peptidase [Pseudofulvibacter geojedonensis]|uniref:S41 family peptidase n=1 Tax=Pseudofulvibacter geojedonensis TaxID=1123758 RepID=A0ABW3I3H6_9FLAO
MGYQKKYLPLIIGVTLAIGFWFGGLFRFGNNTPLLASAKKQKLNRLIDYIDYEYVDEVDTDSIVDVTVNKILENLDPHSVYIPEKNLAAVTESMNGEFVGIGVSFYLKKDTISVIKAIQDGPSEKVGIKGGDKILLANNDTLYGKKFSSEDVVKKLKGELNSVVDLTIYRPVTDSVFKVRVERDKVPIKSVPVAYMLEDRLGYIKINRFAETTYKEFKEELTKLQKQNLTHLVLDLRGNPGGFLDRANQIIDEFLEDDKLIMFTKNKKGNIEKFFATSKGSFEKGHVYVLIDEDAASASEIVAGALQDNDKGTIVGRRSFGKGLVQREMQLGDGSAIRLTVSRYYTPTGRSIQKPYKNQKEGDYYDDYAARYTSGELTDSTKIEVADSLKFTTPRGKVVYGGGGIIPDVFVPIKSNEEYNKVAFGVKTNMLDNFVFDVLENNRKHYHTFSRISFINDFEVSDKLLQEFKDYLRIKTRGELTVTTSEHDAYIKRSIKAAIAEQMFDLVLSYQIKDEDDTMINKVKELLEK